MTTVVLCGSLGSTSEMWDAQRPALAGRRVVVVEHPGHGGAPVTRVATVRDLAARVLEQVGDGDFSFVGLSLGGAVGMQLALEAPKRVERLVLSCTAARFGDPQQWLERAATVRSEGLEAIVDAVLGRWFTPAFRDTGRWRPPGETGRGRGLAVMRELMDDVEIAPSDQGTTVTLRRRLRGDGVR